MKAEVKTSQGTINIRQIEKTIKELEKNMTEAARTLRFEEAAEFRDEIKRLKRIRLAVED